MKHTFLLISAVGLVACLCARVHAEGSAQVGTAQRLQNSTSIRVDIIDIADETITWTGQGTAQIRSPSNVLVATLSNTQSYAPTVAGTFSVTLSSSQTGAWDIAVSNTSPGFGRVHAQQWDYNTGTFSQSAASSASYYALVPGGAANSDGVVELKLNGLSGNQYSIGANRTGVDGANAGRSVPTSGNSLTASFEMYLLPPEVGHYNPVTPLISNFSYGSGTQGCGLISAGKMGTFSFTANVAGTYNLVCDLDNDTVFNRVAATDLLLVGLTINGQNSVVWNGKNNAGNDVASGNYNCKVFVNTGELHYVGRDIETSYLGLQLYAVNQALVHSGLNMFWNDTAVQANDVNMPAPTNVKGTATSGANGVNPGSYASAALANSTAHSWGNFASSSKGNNAFIDTFASILSTASTALSVKAVASNADADSDSLNDYLESCTLGTNPMAADSDGDGLSDSVETNGGNPIDTDGTGGIDANDPDSDGDGVNDGMDVSRLSSSACRDQDADGCDDCSNVHTGGGSVSNDGTDTDQDGACNGSDSDDDGDGVLDGADVAPLDAARCKDADADTCDDCSMVHTGGGSVTDDGPDSDLDGQCNAHDGDDDNDGVADANDSAPTDAHRCRDMDGDACDDCAVTGGNGSGGNINDDGADANHDGVCDAQDADGDGVVDANDLDIDNDGIPNSDEGSGDRDGDGLDNAHDLDADGDGISDLVEAGGSDKDGDGRVDDPKDANHDGLDDRVAAQPLPRPDTDGDGLRDFLDLDSDGDGASDLVEAGGESLDVDHDGRVDDARDANHNGWSDAIDGDAALPTRGDALPIPDTDSDGKLDFRDLDSDDDGVPDAIEAHDDNRDGQADVEPGEDDNGDGWRDGYKPSVEPPDADGDGKPDYRDVDDDDDGRPTSDELREQTEHGADVDSDGKPNYLDDDSDGDDVSDRDENADQGDVDDDGTPDYVQPKVYPQDVDGDGVLDFKEKASDGNDARDSDGDGTPDSEDDDDDGDGIPTRVERVDGEDTDSDGDGKPDYLDPDDDGDGIPTLNENGKDGRELDVDRDGTPNYLDEDSDGDGLLDALESSLDANKNGVPDYREPPRVGYAGGAGCAVAGESAPSNVLLWFGLGLWLSARKRRSMRFITSLLGVLALSLTAAGAARADGFALNRYLPAALPSDGFAVSRPNDLGHLRLAANIQIDYANDPLVLELNPGKANTEGAAVVHHQLVPHAALSLGLLDRIVVGADLAFNAVQRGERFTDPLTGERVRLSDGAGLGDANFLMRVRLLGDAEALFALAVQARLTLPLAQVADSEQRFSGEHGVSVLPELLAELRLGQLRITGNLGTRIRSTSELPRAPVESGLRYALGLGLRVLPALQLLAEAHGETGFDHFFKRATTATELLGGAKLWFGDSGFMLGAAAGPGLSRAVGTPDFRVIGMLGYESPARTPEPPARDSDHDQIPDDQDACPTQPEDRDNFEDMDGCAEPDNDRDGILDAADSCPREPEDRDDFEDQDGCPEPDNDRDGILDAADSCPEEAEDKDGWKDDDGCPDPDNDGDGVLDAVDKCPRDAGPPADQGCPRARVEQGQIRILDRVEFATGKDTILPSSEPILEAVRKVLAEHTDIAKLRIEGHTDDRGSNKTNRELSLRRAASVVRWLTQRKIESERLSAWGCGEEYPLLPNSDDPARQANRRVEFHIEGATDGEATREKCQALKP